MILFRQKQLKRAQGLPSFLTLDSKSRYMNTFVLLGIPSNPQAQQHVYLIDIRSLDRLTEKRFTVPIRTLSLLVIFVLFIVMSETKLLLHYR